MARNPLWAYVQERDGLGLTVDTGAIVSALLGGIVGAFTDVATGGVRALFAVVTSPFAFGRDVAVAGITLLGSLLPGVITQSAQETASNLSTFGVLAFLAAIVLGVVLVVVIVRRSTSLGVSFFG